MNKFDQLVEFISEKHIITRKDMLIKFPEMRGVATYDNYRNWLTHAGYLRVLSRGIYQRKKIIPNTLTSRSVRREAYPKMITNI